jgi:glycosyltransferase involved in cell wall biosynthesis
MHSEKLRDDICSMKLCLLIRSLDVGGTQTQVRELTRGLADRGHDVYVITFYDCDDPTNREQIRYFSLGKRGRYDLIVPGWRVVSLIRSIRPDVLYSFLPTANILGAMIKYIVPTIRVAWGVRAVDMRLKEFDWLSHLCYKIQPRLAWGANIIICNSEAARDHAALTGIPIELLEIVHNGFNTEHFFPAKLEGAVLRAEWGVGENETLIGHVGRPDPMKDIPTFLKASAKLSELRPDLKFVCVGGGNETAPPMLPTNFVETELKHRLLWIKERRDMRAVYNALDLLVSTSVTESLPNSVGEAMSCGVPCVATRVGDCAELLGKTGVIAAPEDPAAISEAVLSVLNLSDDERRELGHAARNRIKSRYDKTTMVVATEKLLSSLA